MKTASPRNGSAVLLIVLALGLSGCLNLKPVADTSRYFALMPLSAAPSASSAGPALGIGGVEIPDYLQSKRIALRKGSNEIEYSESLKRAERLDKGIQRVL
jgi:uncharacterized lipoprotein YmbA